MHKVNCYNSSRLIRRARPLESHSLTESRVKARITALPIQQLDFGNPRRAKAHNNVKPLNL